MTHEQFIEKLCAYAKTVLAPKTQNKMTQFILGASTVGAGRKMLENYVNPFLAVCGDTIVLDDLRASVISGIKVSGIVPILGGRINLEETDVVDFFNFAAR